MAIHKGTFVDCASALTSITIAAIRILTFPELFNDDEFNPVMSSGFRKFDLDLDGDVDLADSIYALRVQVGTEDPAPGPQRDHLLEVLRTYSASLGFYPSDRGGREITMNDIVKEFGGTEEASLKEYLRGFGRVPDVVENINIPYYDAAMQASGIPAPEVTMEDFYGATNVVTVTISQNVQELDLVSVGKQAGYQAGAILRCIVNEGVYCWSDNVNRGGINVTTISDKVQIFNYGYIMGKGGNGANAGNSGGNGGPAILIERPPEVEIVNHSTGYIGGGGGGGSAGWQSGGGGGAGGGRGGNTAGGSGGGAGGAIGQKGSNTSQFGGNTYGYGGEAGGSGGGVQENKGGDSQGGGGGGGRIFPGQGVNAAIPSGELDDWAGGYGGAAGQNGGDYGLPYWQNPTQAGGTSRYSGVGGGGGGWGANGGDGDGGSYNGGLGGPAVTWSSGTGYVRTVTGTLDQVYGDIVEATGDIDIYP